MSEKFKKRKEFDRSYYSYGLYSDYERESRRVMKIIARRIVKKANLKRGSRVLDAGCGKGFLVYFLRANFSIESYGVDVSPYAVINSLPQIKKFVRKGNIMKLPFKANYFDVVTSFEVVYYLNNNELKAALNEMKRVTKKYLFISSIYKHSWQASQRNNPDKLRPKKLLTKKELIKEVELTGMKFIQKFYAETGGDILVFTKKKKR